MKRGQVGFWVTIFFMLLPGCGVLDVPDAAVEAVEDWSETKTETQPCRINAMTHCVAASGVASQCGLHCALILGVLVETRQLDFDPMDFHNNLAGARCAEPITSSAGGAVNCCGDLLNREPPGLRTDGKCD